MIGNMSNCTTIQDALRNWSGKEINFGLINPKTSVSEGAAIKGYILEGGERTFVLKKQDTHAADFEQTEAVNKAVESEILEGVRSEQKFDKEIKSVLSASVGILAKKKNGENFVYKLLRKNMFYPVEKMQEFKVSTDKAETQCIDVYEGESENIEDCTFIGSLEIHLDRKLSYGSPIQITLSKDKNGILQVEAVNQKSGIRIKSEVKRHTGLSESELKEAAEKLEDLWI